MHSEVNIPCYMYSVESHQNVDLTVELAIALAIVTSRYQKTSDGKESMSKRRKSDSPLLTIAEVLALNDWATESHQSIALTKRFQTASIWITRLQILDTFKWSLVGNKLSDSEIEVGIRKRLALLSKALKYVKCPVDVHQLLEVYAISLINLHPICYKKGVDIVGKSLNKFIRSVLNRWLGSVEDFEDHDRAWLTTEALIIRVCRIPSDRSLLSETVGKFKTYLGTKSTGCDKVQKLISVFRSLERLSSEILHRMSEVEERERFKRTTSLINEQLALIALS